MLVAAFCIDVKKTFDHVSKAQLFTQMIELGVDDDLVTWASSFLTDRKVQLVIDRPNNKEKEINTGISEDPSISPIFSLTYICRVFAKISKTSLLFIDNLGFLASGSSVKEIVRSLKKVNKEVIEWEKQNAETYNTSKTKAVLFSKSYRQQLNKQLWKAKIEVGGEKILFNKKTMK